MEIKFYWNGSFVGSTYSMTIDGEDIDIGMTLCMDEDEVKEEIIRVLKNNYNIDYSKKQIEFVWGGAL